MVNRVYQLRGVLLYELNLLSIIFYLPILSCSHLEKKGKSGATGCSGDITHQTKDDSSCKGRRSKELDKSPRRAHSAGALSSLGTRFYVHTENNLILNFT